MSLKWIRLGFRVTSCSTYLYGSIPWLFAEHIAWPMSKQKPQLAFSIMNFNSSYLDPIHLLSGPIRSG